MFTCLFIFNQNWLERKFPSRYAYLQFSDTTLVPNHAHFGTSPRSRSFWLVEPKERPAASSRSYKRQRGGNGMKYLTPVPQRRARFRYCVFFTFCCLLVVVFLLCVPVCARVSVRADRRIYTTKRAPHKYELSLDYPEEKRRRYWAPQFQHQRDTLGQDYRSEVRPREPCPWIFYIYLFWFSAPVI